MRDSFLRKFVSTVLAGLAAAALLWFFRHVVEQARYETNEGWREMFKKPTPAQRR